MKFCDKTDFTDVRIQGLSTFQQAHFYGDVFFKGDSVQRLFRDKDGKACVVRFREASFAYPERVLFRNVDFGKATFMHVDVERLVFSNTRWAHIDSGVGVYDELEARRRGNPVPHDALEKLYRRLKQNYEEQRDYGRAGDFHFREKEMLRINDDTSAQKRFLLNVYKALSGYGERLWAARSFVVLIFLSAIVSLAIGLESSHIGHAERLVNGQLRLWRLDNLFSSLLYALQLAFLRRPENFSTASHWADFVRFTTMVTGPILIGLFALAVRQKLKR